MPKSVQKDTKFIEKVLKISMLGSKMCPGCIKSRCLNLSQIRFQKYHRQVLIFPNELGQLFDSIAQQIHSKTNKKIQIKLVQLKYDNSIKRLKREMGGDRYGIKTTSKGKGIIFDLGANIGDFSVAEGWVIAMDKNLNICFLGPPEALQRHMFWTFFVFFTFSFLDDIGWCGMFLGHLLKDTYAQ